MYSSVQSLLGLRCIQRSRVRVLALARNFFEHLRKRTRLKGLFFQFFFGTLRLFSNFLLSNGPTLIFLIFCSKLKCQKAQRASPFKYFGTMRLFKIIIFRVFFENLKKSIFLVSKGSSLQFFDILQTGFSKSPKAPFHSFKRFSSLRYTADFRRSRLVGLTA